MLRACNCKLLEGERVVTLFLRFYGLCLHVVPGKSWKYLMGSDGFCSYLVLDIAVPPRFGWFSSSLVLGNLLLMGFDGFSLNLV